MINSRSLRTLLASALASSLTLHAGASFADDTEVFFGGNAAGAGIRPNVMFLLDDSGSMAWCTNSNNADTCQSANNRMAILKSTMTNLLNTTSGINAGLMVLNNRAGSPRDASLSKLLFPATNIDAPYNYKLANPEIKVSADDASRSSGATNITDPVLLMGYVSNPDSSNTVARALDSTDEYANNSTYYLRSNGGSTYTCTTKINAVAAGYNPDLSDTGSKVVPTTECPESSADRINFINANSGSQGRDGLLLFRDVNIPPAATIVSAKLIIKPDTPKSITSFNVALVNSKTPGAFNDSSPIDTSIFTSNTLVTSALSSGAHELDLKTLLTTLKSAAPSANPLSDIAIRLRSSTSTDFKYYVSGVGAPSLVITYTGVGAAVARTTGLRFESVNIPQGASITSAKLSFVPAASDHRPVSFDIAAEASDNASIFSTSEDFTGRSKTASVNWDASEWRTKNPSVSVDSVDVSAQVQAVVSRSGWCGNNAMAFFLAPTSGDGARIAYSQDGNNSLKPVLTVDYTGGDAGCLNPIADISIIDGKDDGREYYYDNRNKKLVDITESQIYFADNSTSSIYSATIVGARYQKVPFRAGAQVLDAAIIVTPSSSAGASVTTDVYFEKAANSSAFTTNNGNFSGRTPTAATSCTFTSQGKGIPVECRATGLIAALQSVLSSANGWSDGNAISVFLKQTSPSSKLVLRSFDLSPGDAIRLQVQVKNGGMTDNGYKVRDYLKGLVDKMTADGGTPLVPQLAQVSKYYTDISGKHRGPPSPIESSCQTNYVVLMTDGQANGADSSPYDLINSCASRSNADEVCGPDLVRWLNTTDQSATIPDKNLVQTHTIGFALQANNAAKQYLKDIAAAGGGKAYDVSNASELSSAFNNIIQEVLSTNTTFASASAPVNSFNRADNKDQLYLALFRPGETNRWVGNLKRYRLAAPAGESTVAILDADNAKAINPTTGFFSTNSRSFWDSARDGDDVGKGGAAKQLPSASARKLYTYPAGSGSTTLTHANNSLSAGNSLITATLLGDSNMTVSKRSDLLNYIRGLNSDSTERKAMGDPIHSSPRLFSYGCKGYDSNKQCLTASGDDNADQYALIGTNEGFVQLIDTSSGQEVFGFMPEGLLKNISWLYDDAKSTEQKPRPYGVDNTVTVWANDINGNGVIYGDPNATPPTTSGLNTGEGVYAYVTMGRGGRNIYALDITDKASPKIMWQIIGGGTPGFERLGQTWSAPIKTKIKNGSAITDVLIFAGGYDPAQDNLNQSNSVRTADGQGNAIYIVNAKTGALIWSASSASGHSVQLAKMIYSMPSAVRVIDVQENNGKLVADPDRLADQIFVGDMGGQVWRFFINNGQTGAALVSPGGSSGDGVFASLGGSDATSARRFYHEPDVALVMKNGVRNLSVNIGSGYRGHPLNKFIIDRFYSLRTPLITRPSGTGAINEGTLIESNLYDATANLVQSGTASTKQAADTALAAASGWYMTMAGTGEKVLSRALTFGGYLFFNTYEPSTAAGLCKASVGVNRSYAVRLEDASPVSVPVGSTGSYADRYTTSNSQGISGDPQLFCQGNDCSVLQDISLPTKKVPMPKLGSMYWNDSLN